jgi:hypothetical protein
MEQSQILDADLSGAAKKRRRQLLPWWMKVFSWIFMVFGGLAVLGFLLGLLGITFQLQLYGLETNEPVSLLGLGLTAIFLIKGAAAFGLWMEKDWAINVGMLDAILGLVICTFMMFVSPLIDQQSGFRFTIRLELILLIPYVIALRNLKPKWEALNSDQPRDATSVEI